MSDFMRQTGLPSCGSSPPSQVTLAGGFAFVGLGLLLLLFTADSYIF